MSFVKGICEKCGSPYKSYGNKFCSRACYLASLQKNGSSVKDEHIAREVNLDLLARLYLSRPLNYKEKVGNTKEAVIFHFSDWHIGKLIVDVDGKEVFNLEIAKQRAESFCQKGINLVKKHILGRTKISKIVVLISGDMADGEGVYEGQSNNLELVPPKQVIACARVMISFFKALLILGLPIEVCGVKGNHGNTGKDRSVASNWDLMLYMILELWARESGIKNFSIKYSETDFLKVNVNGWKYLLRHQGVATTETPAGASKAYGWRGIHDIDALVYGHLHHPNIGTLNNIRTFMGGSLPGIDDFSERIAKGTAPFQLMWGVSRDHISTFIYIIDLQ